MNKNFRLKRNYLSKNADMPVKTIRAAYRSVTVEPWKIDLFPSLDRENSVENFSVNRILAGCPSVKLDALFPYLESVSLSSDEYIYQSGDAIKHIYFPETAVISEMQILEDGKTIETAMIGNEGITGLSAIFDSQPAACWTQVSVGGKALKLDLQIFKQEFKGGTLQNLLLRFIDFYVRQITQRVICNSHHLIENRLCNWLLMISDRHRSDKFSLTQEQIARFLGVHRPSISNIAHTLRDKQVIDYNRGNITILNRHEMEDSACSCYESLQNVF